MTQKYKSLFIFYKQTQFERKLAQIFNILYIPYYFEELNRLEKKPNPQLSNNNYLYGLKLLKNIFFKTCTVKKKI